jgi:hypothetical protein
MMFSIELYFPRNYLLFLNIFNILSVIKKPPTALMEEAMMAMVPRTMTHVLSPSPVRAKEPTREIEEIAFVKDIRGVCNKRETFRINSSPKKDAKTKMYRLVIQSFSVMVNLLENGKF